MQHMCALMRDHVEGESVNLGPSERPNDQYADIIDLLEKKRVRDARAGCEEAIILEGFLERTVVKHVFMRVGYGATRNRSVWRDVRFCSILFSCSVLFCRTDFLNSTLIWHVFNFLTS